MKSITKKIASAFMLLILTVALLVPIFQVSAASISLNKTKLIIVVGQKYQLKLNGTKKTPVWKTTNKKIITVNKNGVVAGVSKGTANVTATIGKSTYKCKITVEAPKLSVSKKVISAGDKFVLKFTGTTRSVKWVSNNAKVATVTQKGVVKGIAKGTANIVATINGKKYICKVIVETPSLSETQKTIKVGKSFVLSVTGTSRAIKWSSSNPKVITVNQKGVVKGIAKGNANIIANIAGKKYICKVSVTAPRILNVSTNNITIKNQGVITVSFDGNGSIYYEVDDSNIVTCKWDDGWDGNKTKLYLTGKYAGKTKITITNDDNNEKCVINVKVDKSVLSVSNNNLSIRDKGYVKVKFLAYGTVKYAIDNPNIVACKWDGDFENSEAKLLVIGKRSGTTYLTISNSYNSETQTIKVTVDKPNTVKSITMSESKVVLYKDDHYGNANHTTLSVYTVPDRTSETVFWESSNLSVAKVDTNGNVVATGTGVATITAICGDKSAECTVVVKKHPLEGINMCISQERYSSTYYPSIYVTNLSDDKIDFDKVAIIYEYGYDEGSNYALHSYNTDTGFYNGGWTSDINTKGTCTYRSIDGYKFNLDSKCEIVLMATYKGKDYLISVGHDGYEYFNYSPNGTSSQEDNVYFVVPF